MTVAPAAIKAEHLSHEIGFLTTAGGGGLRGVTGEYNVPNGSAEALSCVASFNSVAVEAIRGEARAGASPYVIFDGADAGNVGAGAAVGAAVA